MTEELTRDALTGLYDFKSFIKVTEALLEANPDKNFDIFVWDIIQFKVINDIYGMDVGDKLLRDLAMEIVYNVRTGTCGRVGNDKFVCCIFADMSYKVNDISNVYDFYVSDKIGIHKIFMQGGCYHVTDRTIPVIKMCDRAILALNRIKGKLTETVAEYKMENREEILIGQRLATDLDNALMEHQFKIYIQPIYNANSGTIASGEVLVRWDHPELGFLPPGRFIPYFEQNYLITKVDKYVWEEACRLIRQMMDEGVNIIPLSINISRTDLLFDDVSEILLNLVCKYGINPRYLRVEITESAYIDNPGLLEETMILLKNKGFTILMDDFGTGYSSLNSLRNLPFNIIKIDKTLIDEIDKSEKAGNVVSAIVNMANWLNMEVVAEGVEEISQLNFLKHIGCRYIQGYYFSKPLSEKEFRALDFDKSSCKEEKSEEININTIFGLTDPESRSILDKVIGPLIQYESDGEELYLRRVNSEFMRVSRNSNPYSVVEHDNKHGIAESNKRNFLFHCRLAKEKNDVIQFRDTLVRPDGSEIKALIRVFYLGRENGRDQFLFRTEDISKENDIEFNQQIIRIFAIMPKIYSKILLLNFSDNVVSDICIDKDKTVEANISYSGQNKPLDRFIESNIKYICEEDRERIIEKFSSQAMVEFCRSEDKIKYISYHINLEGEKRPAEMIVINNVDRYNKISVVVGNRILD